MNYNNNEKNKEIKDMNIYINMFIDELNKDSKIIIMDKIKTLQYQRINQIKLISKLKNKINKLKKALIIKKDFWDIIVFESCDIEIQEYDSIIRPISENIKRTEYDMNESIYMLVDYLYRYVNWFFENNFY